jgi:hypothetical protein
LPSRCRRASTRTSRWSLYCRRILRICAAKCPSSIKSATTA